MLLPNWNIKLSTVLYSCLRCNSELKINLNVDYNVRAIKCSKSHRKCFIVFYFSYFPLSINNFFSFLINYSQLNIFSFNSFFFSIINKRFSRLLICSIPALDMSSRSSPYNKSCLYEKTSKTTLWLEILLNPINKLFLKCFSVISRVSFNFCYFWLVYNQKDM